MQVADAPLDIDMAPEIIPPFIENILDFEPIEDHAEIENDE
jgi:hypothetical protein